MLLSSSLNFHHNLVKFMYVVRVSPRFSGGANLSDIVFKCIREALNSPNPCRDRSFYRCELR